MIQTSAITLINQIITALKADVALNDYVLAAYGKNFSYFVGIDQANQPESSSQPFMAFRPGSWSPSDDRTHRVIEIAMALVVSNDETTTTDGVTTLSGLASIEALYFAVERALEVFFGGIDYNYTPDYNSMSLDIGMPFFRVTWNISLEGDY